MPCLICKGRAILKKNLAHHQKVCSQIEHLLTVQIMTMNLKNKSGRFSDHERISETTTNEEKNSKNRLERGTESRN